MVFEMANQTTEQSFFFIYFIINVPQSALEPIED